MLQPTKSSRERILVMGGWGAGKTNGWAKIAEWSRRTESPAKFYVIDADFTCERTLEEWDDWEDNVIVETVSSWAEYLAALTSFENKISKENNDWIVLDPISKAWAEVQDEFTERRFKKDASEFFLESVEAGKKGHPLASDYGINWSVINKMYQEFMGPITRLQSHVYACAPVDTVRRSDEKGKGGDSAEVLNIFGRWGVKPQGQKNLGYQFHSLLLFQEQGEKWTMSTIRDRARERVTGKVLKDFVTDYLIEIAGWEI